MAQILVRNLDDALKERLRVVAASHGHSMEEEARLILHRALAEEAVPSSTESQVGLGEKIHAQFMNIDVPQEFFDALEEMRHGSDLIDVTPRFIDFTSRDDDR